MTVRTLRLPFALGVELMWSYAAVAIAVHVAGRGDGPAPSLVAVAAVVLGSFALGRGLQQTDLDESSLRNAGAAATIILLAVILRAEYGGLAAPWSFGWLRDTITEPGAAFDAHADVIVGCAALIALWVRGAATGQQTTDFSAVSRSAAFGLVVVAIAAALSPDARGPQSFGGLALLYVPVSLITLALFQSADAEKPAARFAAEWAPALAALLGAAALLAIVAAAIDPASLGFIAPIGRPLAIAVAIVAEFVLGPIVGGIGWLFGAILPHSTHELPKPQIADTPAPDPTKHGTPLWFRIVGYTVAGGALTLLVTGSLVGLWFMFRRFTKRKPRPIEKREQIEGESLLGEDLGAMFGALASRFRRSPRRPASAIAIRRLYSDLIDRAAADGLDRAPSATPSHFAPSLDAHFASDAPSAITDAFAASRYGRHEPEDAEVRALRERWRR